MVSPSIGPLRQAHCYFICHLRSANGSAKAIHGGIRRTQQSSRLLQAHRCEQGAHMPLRASCSRWPAWLWLHTSNVTSAAAWLLGVAYEPSFMSAVESSSGSGGQTAPERHRSREKGRQGINGGRVKQGSGNCCRSVGRSVKGSVGCVSHCLLRLSSAELERTQRCCCCRH